MVQKWAHDKPWSQLILSETFGKNKWKGHKLKLECLSIHLQAQEHMSDFSDYSHDKMCEMIVFLQIISHRKAGIFNFWREFV